MLNKGAAMRLRCGKLIIFCAAIAIVCRGNESNMRLIDGIAAVVNRHVITVGDVFAAAQRDLVGLSQESDSKDLSARARKIMEEAREAIIERYLILDSRDPKTQRVPDWIVDERIRAISRESFGDDKVKLGAVLQRNGMTYDQWREEIRDSVMISALRSARVDHYARMLPAERGEKGKGSESGGSLAPRVKINAIVLGKGSTDAEAEQQRATARDIVRRLREGADFAEVAREHSRGGRVDSGGDWGWLRLDELRKDFAEAVSKVEPGGVSDPVEAGGEIYILKVLGREDKAADTETESLLAAERKRVEAQARDIYKVWVANLRRRALVKTFDLEPFLAAAR